MSDKSRPRPVSLTQLLKSKADTMVT